MKKRWSILVGILFLAFLLLTLYPLIGQAVNRHYQSQVHGAYLEELSSETEASLEDARKAAHAYNATLISGTADAFTKDAIQSASLDYEKLLDLTSTGIMGYVRIPMIEVELPIYHGTGNDSLDAGIGHLVGTSLPVGGSSTHCVLSGHTGMAGQKMLTDLEKLRPGDRFYLDVLGETLAYEVDAINTVLPHETELLRILPGEDHVTLVTCTPYGVNSHRLLVRGNRVEENAAGNAEELANPSRETAGSTWEEQYLRGVLLGIDLSIFLLIAYCICHWLFRLWKRRNSHET